MANPARHPAYPIRRENVLSFGKEADVQRMYHLAAHNGLLF
ncbi:hypothetical protein [Hymenobacter sp. 5516J-16]|nr:hypothetical protein [Hymenobacter sp. 5516J-16]